MLYELAHEVLKKNPSKEIKKTRVELLMALDPDYKKIVNDAEEYWLSKANEVLKEIITAIRSKIAAPDVTMQDLVKALDVISNKYNIDMGKPTSIGLDYKLQITKDMDDGEIDKRLLELEKQFLPKPPTRRRLTHDAS